MLRDFFTREKTEQIDELIAAVTLKMKTTDLDSEEYQTYLKHLERLNEIKAKERRNPVSLDTVLMVGGNILIAIIVVAYERTHVTTSKGWNHILRPKELK